MYSLFSESVGYATDTYEEIPKRDDVLILSNIDLAHGVALLTDVVSLFESTRTVIRIV
jgi:hypothetical protein